MYSLILNSDQRFLIFLEVTFKVHFSEGSHVSLEFGTFCKGEKIYGSDFIPKIGYVINTYFQTFFFSQ